MTDDPKPALDYKSSVFLPKTEFPMKGDLPKREPERVARWQAEDLYGKIRAARKGAPKFVLHDGPPYANSDLHLGHALNHSLKDFVVKSRTMLGYDAPFRPGWDCHGLPIEQWVEKAVGRGKLKAMSAREIREASRAHALKVIEAQKAGILRLGVMGEFGAPQETVAGPGYYRTLGNYYEAGEVRVFGEMYKKGLAYKALKSVHWCGSCHTALAEAEIEYEQKVDPSVYVGFQVTVTDDAHSALLKDGPLYAVIWTTTPWTLPANRAIAVHPEEEYIVVKPLGGERKYLVAKKLEEALAQLFGWPNGERVIASGITWQQLQSWKYLHPLAPATPLEPRPLEARIANLEYPFVAADYVEMDTGTGLVHTAPGHGIDDYYTGVKYNLEIACPVDEHGRLQKLFPTVPDEVVGLSIWDANPIVIEILKKAGLLLLEGRLDHSYPCCWRCHNKLFFRATPQWFISMDKKALLKGDASLRGLALEAIDQLNITGGWVPAWGFERIRNMIAARPDWCVSRQRLWGVPIAVFYCMDEKCEAVYATPESFEKIAGLFEKEGCDGWYELPPEYYLPAGAKCEKCGGATFRKETDILDVWFDSGASHRLTLPRPAANEPWADLYLEGSDQHRGWFHTSLLIGVALDEKPPFRQVLTHGFTLDGQGRPMSKSMGNGIDPDEINNKYGAEVLRLWVAASDYGSDIRISQPMLTQHAEGYRKFRNTIKFMLGALSDFNPATDLVKSGALAFPDQLLLQQAKTLFMEVAGDYARYQFHALYRKLNEFTVLTLSNFYLSLHKDTLYILPANHPRRRSAQSAIFITLRALIKALAPLLPFTAEEAYALLPEFAGKFASVHLDEFDAALNLAGGRGVRPDDFLAAIHSDPAVETRGAEYLLLRDKLLKALEGARGAGAIGDSLEAVLFVETLEPTLAPLLDFFGDDAAFYFGVSELHRHPLDGRDPAFSDAALRVWVVPADEAPCHPSHKKCARCWWRTADVGSAANFPGVCARCAGFLTEMKWQLGKS